METEQKETKSQQVEVPENIKSDLSLSQKPKKLNEKPNKPAGKETEKTVARKIEKIYGMKQTSGKKYFLVKYVDSKDDEVVEGSVIRKHNQKALLNFYEEYIKLVDIGQEPDLDENKPKPANNPQTTSIV